MRTRILALLVATLTSAALAQTQDLATLRQTFETTRQKLGDGTVAARLSLQDQYLRALSAMEARLQQAGQLDPVLIVRTERERFTADREVQEKDLTDRLPELRTCQGKFLQALANTNLDSARRTVNLGQQYDRALNTLQETLTRQGAFDAAVEVKTERQRLADLPELAEARDAIAEADAQRAAARPAKTEPTPAAPTPAPKKTVETTKKKYTGKAENYIRKRYDQLCDAIVDQKWDQALQFIDPEFVKRRGADDVQLRMQFVFPFLKFVADSRQLKLKAGHVEVAEDETSAVVTPRIWLKGEWRDQANVSWVQVDGDWYMEIEPLRPPMNPGGAKKNAF